MLCFFLNTLYHVGTIFGYMSACPQLSSTYTIVSDRTPACKFCVFFLFFSLPGQLCFPLLCTGNFTSINACHITWLWRWTRVVICTSWHLFFFFLLLLHHLLFFFFVYLVLLFFFFFSSTPIDNSVLNIILNSLSISTAFCLGPINCLIEGLP